MAFSDKLKIKNKFFLFFIILLLIIIFTILSFCVFAIYIYISTPLDKNLISSISSPISIYDSNEKKVMQSLSGSPYIKLSNLNPYTYNAFINVEDKEFFNHIGINVKRMIKAFSSNILAGEIEQGASTITQQFIKNAMLTNEKTYIRKLKEIALALKLEQEYSKEQILEMYLNVIYFGNSCYGIENASQFYFNKKAKDLTINESAILAGIIKSPYNYSPLTNNKDITTRKNFVLKQMLNAKTITNQEYNTAVNESVETVNEFTSKDNSLPYFSCAIEEACKILNLKTSQISSLGLKIYTYYDEEANKALVENSISNTNALHNSIIVDNDCYGIKAYSSSLPFGAIDLNRTPASTLKPILVYSPALELGIIQPATLILDEKTTFSNNYSPKNINDKYYGYISSSQALAKSLNVPAVKILDKIGIQNAKKFANRFNISFDDDDNGLSLALGSMKYGITITDLVNAYSPFANGGFLKNATFIKKICDKNSNVIYENKVKRTKVISEETAYLTASMLKESVQNGTCQALKNFNFDILAKSGTNGTSFESKNTDSICIAQTSIDTACIWYYSKDYTEENLLNSPILSGLSPTLRMKSLFENLYKTQKPTNLVKPNNVENVYIDKLEYEINHKLLLSNLSTPNTYKEKVLFNKKFTPTKTSSNFTTLVTPILNYSINSNILSLSFSSLQPQEYDLIEEIYSNNELISTNKLVHIEKEKGKQMFSKALDSNYQYKFYIKTKFLQKSEIKQSNIISI